MHPFPFQHPEEVVLHQEFLRRVARALLNDAALAEDAAQETWVAALQSSVRRPEAWRAWLLASLRHVSHKLRRGEERRRAREHQARGARPPEPTDHLVERLELHRHLVEAVLALREPYRSTLCLRYYEDLGPPAIAERLGVPLDTVRSRLRRALHQLREKMRVHPEDWRGLAALAGFPFPPPRAAPVGLLGKVLPVVGVSGVVILGAGLVVNAAGGEPAASGAPAGLTATPEAASAPDAKAPLPPLEALRVEEEGVREGSVEEHRGAASFGSARAGAIRMDVCDAATGELLPEVEVRFLGLSRFARYTGAGDLRELLSPDVYEILVTARGHDPLRLGRCPVPLARQTDLGVVSLRPGTGRIEAEIAAGAAGTARVVVELRGPGRGRCPSCPGTEEELGEEALPRPLVERRLAAGGVCAACGHGRDFSAVAIAPWQRASFPRLAAGVYWLQAWTEDGEELAPAQFVELGAGETKRVELMLWESRSLSFSLEDENGEAWVPWGREEGEGVLLCFQAGTDEIAMLRVAPPASALRNGDWFFLEQDFDPPRTAELVWIQAHADPFAGEGLDRPRLPGDRLEAPGLGFSPFAVVRARLVEGNVLEVVGLPADPLAAFLETSQHRSQPFATTWAAESAVRPAVQMELGPRETAAYAVLEDATGSLTITDCLEITECVFQEACLEGENR